MEFTLNNYRFKKFGDKYFLTTDHGSYCILSEEEFNKLKQSNIDENLLKKLEEKEIILNENNFNEAVRLTVERNQFLLAGTSLHIVIPTLRCNMNCIYCHASSRPLNEKGYDMDKETAKNTVDFIFQTPNRYITIEFQGGEPLLNWEIVKYIVEYALEKNRKAKKDLVITIVTNLTEMTEEKMEYLIDHNVTVCTSLDGPKEVHNYNRKFIGGNNYDIVVKWIKKFNSEYEKRKIKHKLNALVTLTRKSLNHPKEIVDEYVNLGLNNIHLRFLNHLGVAKKVWSSINYSVEEYLNFWKKAVSYIDEVQKKGVNINERMIGIMLHKISQEYDPNYLDLRSPCGAAIGQLAYNYNGDIYTCDEARSIGEDLFLLGNVKNNSYKEIVTCNKACAVINASINDQYICDNCVYKPYCGICPVCNYVDQGNMIGKISQTDRCKIFKEQFDWVVKEKFINNQSNN
jgi:His-Xaa-Ser system radical SAM maturase HxsB